VTPYPAIAPAITHIEKACNSQSVLITSGIDAAAPLAAPRSMPSLGSISSPVSRA